MTRMSGQPFEMFISWSLRWPYQAKVMQMLEPIRSNMHQKAFIANQGNLVLSSLLLSNYQMSGKNSNFAQILFRNDTHKINFWNQGHHRRTSG